MLWIPQSRRKCKHCFGSGGRTGGFALRFVWLSSEPMAFTDLLHVSCSWNRWRCSWRKSTKTSRKCCAREESWSANCWTYRTRFFLLSVFLINDPRAQACIRTCTLLYCTLPNADWLLLSTVHTCHERGLMRLGCHSGLPEGCGDWEEAEERSKED